VGVSRRQRWACAQDNGTNRAAIARISQCEASSGGRPCRYLVRRPASCAISQNAATLNAKMPMPIHIIVIVMVMAMVMPPVVGP
jgi:hypothetical protein